MAFLHDFNITGGLGDMSAYRMKGVSKIVVRRKGGAKRDKIMNDPAFEMPRRYMTEFGACSTMGKTVRRMMGSQRNLANYNFSGPINALLKVVQKQDKVNDPGKRNIVLSQFPGILEGFSLNEGKTFDSMLRNTLTWSLSRETRSTHVDISRLIPGVNFFAQNNHPMFSLVLSIGIVPDHFFNERTGEFQPNEGYQAGWGAKEIYTEWLPVSKGMDALTLELEALHTPPDDAHSVMLTVGIRFGTLYGGDIVEQVPDAGAAKVLAVR
jgi:hypothetical protein